MRRLLPPALAILCALAAAGVLAAPVLAAADPAVIDCTSHNRLTRAYSATELRHALSTMSADVKEYTSCADIIQRALDQQLAGRHPTTGTSSSSSGGGGGGSFLPTPLIVVLVVVLLGGAVGGAVSLRRRSET